MHKRSKGIGGTDISAIVGMNPFKTQIDVWLDKTGQSEPAPDNENLWWGREMEPVLAKRYEKETGVKLWIPDPAKLPFRIKFKEWYVGSPDALFNPLNLSKNGNLMGAEGGVDFKTSGKPQEWGEPGSDDVPQHYVIQAEWYMGLTGAQWWDIAVLLMGFTRKFAIYRVHRDEELIGVLTNAGEKFWKDHVLTNICPPLDGSKSATEYLKRLYPREQEPILEPTDQDILDLVGRYHAMRKLIKEYTSMEAQFENEIKAIIGDCAGLRGDWGKLTWTKNKDGMVTNWKEAYLSLKAFCEIHDLEIHDRFEAENTTTKPGPRVFRAYFQKED